MQRILFGVLGLLALAAPASAHFPWIVPSADGTKAVVVFSDTLEPDKNVPITKLKALTLTALMPVENGFALMDITLVKKEHTYEVFFSTPVVRYLSGFCKYGVVAKGKSDPFLLMYYPRAILDAKPGPIPFGSGQNNRFKIFGIDPTPTRGAGKPHITGFTVYFQKKPLADAEVVVMVPGSDKEIEGKTDKDGFFPYHVDHNKHPGLYGVRARHVEKKEGKEGDKEYKEIRHYTTLVFRVAAIAKPPAKETKQAKQPPNPEATKLLADARAARASWKNFPGFTADLAVNIDGVVYKGTVEVSESGKVKVTLPEEKIHKWALGQLRSIVSHRLDSSGDRETPCAFADDNVHYPLGRKIHVLNDELHSSYRIRGREITEVNRHMGPSRFTITVLENHVNAEKQLLPSFYVVNTWDTKTNALLSSQAFHQTWVRVGGFDLPRGETIVNAGADTLGARTITLSNHKLLAASKR